MDENVHYGPDSEYEILYFDYSNFMERSAPENLTQQTYNLQMICSIPHSEL